MFPRNLRAAALEAQWSWASLPPASLLPLRARLTTSASSALINPSNISIPPAPRSSPLSVGRIDTTQADVTLSGATSSTMKTSSPKFPSPHATAQSATGPLPTETTALLPLLIAQAPHYATIHIHARPYLVTGGDRVRLPFKMPGVQPGDILRLTHASTLGSRDYTLRGSPYVDQRLFECRAIVVGVESEPMRIKEKTVRRNRKVKRVKSKHKYTELVIKELAVKSVQQEETVSLL